MIDHACFFSNLLLANGRQGHKNFRHKIGETVVGRAMRPLAILSILVVLVLPVPGDGDGDEDGDGDDGGDDDASCKVC